MTDRTTQTSQSLDPARISARPWSERKALVDALLQRYTALEHGNTTADTETGYRLNSLRLASALLQKARLPASTTDAAVHVAVLGPTQAGKSSLVNLLLGSPAAGVSALAGYTVHAHGFTREPVQPADRDTIASVMAPLRESRSTDQNREDLDAYTLQTLDSGGEKSGQPLVSRGIIWDTPDFDSIESGSYRAAVMHAAALADVLILAVSKDKYADRTVWDILVLLRQLGKPLLLVINKLDPADEATVLDSLHKRYQEAFAESPPAIVTLPFQADAPAAWPRAVRDDVRTAVRTAVSAIDASGQRASVEAFIDAHWARWLEPANHEMAAAARWRQMVNSALDDANLRYADRYLNDPDRYDTFNRALAELLDLLEIPGVAAALARTRRWVTWPARTLLGLGRQAMQREQSDNKGVDQEQQMLEGLCEQVLTRLQGEVIEQPRRQPEAALWWQHLDSRLRRSRAGLRHDFNDQAEQYRADFEPRIKAAADKLYRQLQQQPKLLNTLRATRVTTDAAGVALAVKSGGLAPADLVLAPAMLAVTSLLTESALGRYLDRVRNELKALQQTHAAELFNAGLHKPLASLRDDLYTNENLVVDAELAALLDGGKATARG